MSGVFDLYAAYYDLLYEEKDYIGESEYICKLLASENFYEGQILELGSGTGKHAELLARKNFSVHGVDLSDAMVSAANERIPKALSTKLSFQNGDVRKIKLNRKFDVAISLFHVVSYQISNEDLIAMFSTASEHLNAEGIFIFDFWYGPAVLSDRPSVKIKRFENDNISVIRIAEPQIYPNENLVNVKFSLQITTKQNLEIKEIQENHRMRYLFLPELRLLLKDACFEVVLAEKWMSGSLGFDSWQGVIVARKVVTER
jgi:SAM-dependent methyltransferase